MKKIILLLIIFLTSACYNYKEINDLAFISTIGIDYEDEYNLTFEIINSQKKDTFIVSASGKTVSDAFDNISLSISKMPYFYHLKAIVIDEVIAKEHMKEVVEYITRTPTIRNEFFLVMAKDAKASDILKIKSDNQNSIGDAIDKIVTNNHLYSNTTYNKPYEDMLEKFLSNKISAATSVFTIKDDKITSCGIAIFSGYKLNTILNENEAALFNSLDENTSSNLITKKYDNKNISIKSYYSNTNFNLKNNTLTININYEAEIKENNTSLNLKDENTYTKLNKDFASYYKKEIDKLINLFKENNIDPLGFNNYYYIKTKKDINNIYETIDIKTNVKVKVNKKGLIFNEKAK